jgi:valyl-tRNA synthetase
LHKLAIAAKEINIALADREFTTATSTAYQFWYTYFCDVYIENSKLLISDGTPEEQLSAKNTLYTALDGALTMIHPFMPFLTEELWQRLPRRPDDKTPSIMLAAYPVYDSSLDDPASEAAYELVLSVSKAIRSLVAEYAVKDAAVLYIQLFDETSHTTCTQQLPSIRSLSGKSVTSINVLSASDSKPPGCVPAPVSSSATVFLLVKGHIDIDAEIEKAKRKLERAAETVKKHRAILQDEGYHKNVSEELQEAQRQKLRNAEAEVREMEGSVQQFEKLKLE